MFIPATILRINSVMLDTTVRAAFFDRLKPELHDMFLPEHCEIVALAACLVDRQDFLKTFVFDAWFLPALFLVLTKSRDRLLRQEVVRVLKEVTPRSRLGDDPYF
jgi:hypothetical protein